MVCVSILQKPSILRKQCVKVAVKLFEAVVQTSDSLGKLGVKERLPVIDTGTNTTRTG